MVVHLAAQADTPMAFDSPRYTVMQNVDGTVALPEAVRRAGCVKQLIYAGAGNELGRPLYLPIDEEHPLTPHNPYGFSKAAAELALWAWHGAYGVPSIVMSTGAWSSDGRRAGSVHLQVVVERAARLAHPSGGRAADPGRVLHRRRGGSKRTTGAEQNCTTGVMPDGHGLAGGAGGLAWSGAGAGLGRTLIGGRTVRRWR